MSGKTSRRGLLQKTAVAAALIANKAPAGEATNASSEPAWQRIFPPGFRKEKIKTTGAPGNN